MKNYHYLLLLTATSAPAFANWDNVVINGFGSIVATDILSSDNNPGFDEYYLGQKNCPCFITDYYTGGLLDEGEGINLKNETRVGLQIDVAMTEDLSFTLQTVARAITNELSLEWAYASYNISDSWLVQVGRKRIPLYYFSTFQDVGFAYTWVRPPQALYGWEASNYNGANLTYNGNWGNVSVQTSVFAGSETIDDARYNRLYTDNLAFVDDSRWDNIRGIEAEFSYDWLSARVVYLTSDNYVTNKAEGQFGFQGSPTEQRVMGIALNGDFEKWFFHTEKSENRRKNADAQTDVDAPASMIAVGLRFGKWTPFVSWSQYWEESDSPNYLGEAERFISRSITLRYDLNAQNAIKAQIERFDDASQYDFVGDTTVLSLSYDFVF